MPTIMENVMSEVQARVARLRDRVETVRARVTSGSMFGTHAQRGLLSRPALELPPLPFGGEHTYKRDTQRAEEEYVLRG